MRLLCGDDSVSMGAKVEGQNNPFYCAMVELLDAYVGRLVKYLDDTDDPRWPGHKLIENTYVIFTSDNGGMEGSPNEIATDNYPLDKGKISLMEGGTRVPLIITGPGIREATQTDVMVNGLDFYPTILSLTADWSIHWDRPGDRKVPQSHLRSGCNASVPCEWTCCLRRKMKSRAHVAEEVWRVAV